MSINRAFFFVAITVIAVAVDALMACGIQRHDSCGAPQFRATDGATCQECVDADGSRYAKCHL